jgi:prephenate dehydrogenase
VKKIKKIVMEVHKMDKMLIIGGTGETGSWFARYFKDRGFDVSIWGARGRREVADSIGVRYAEFLDEEVNHSDIVIISVPIEKTIEVISKIAPQMSPGSLLMDLTSLKSGPVSAMDRYAPPGVEVLGTHPMFGPTMKCLLGQTVIFTPVNGREGKWSFRLRELFESDGARIELVSPHEHDEIMAVVQALTHFAYIGIGATLKALEVDVERSRHFMSPVYEIMLDFVGRILDQNPDLYASIQGNPLASEVRHAFIGECKRLCDLADQGMMEEFKEGMREAALHYGDTHKALQSSDRIIDQRVNEKHR